jgi:hypothetical protein
MLECVEVQHEQELELPDLRVLQPLSADRPQSDPQQEHKVCNPNSVLDLAASNFWIIRLCSFSVKVKLSL